MDTQNLTIYDLLSNIEVLLLNQKTVLNLDEVATYTGLSKSYLYRLTSTGGIPCYKPHGKHIYFEKAEIDKWLLRNKVKTTLLMKLIRKQPPIINFILKIIPYLLRIAILISILVNFY